MNAQNNMNRGAFLYLVSVAFFGATNGLFDAVYNLLLISHGLSKSNLGQIYTTAMIFMTVFVIPVGYVARKGRLKTVFLLASICYCVPVLFSAVATSLSAQIVILAAISIGMICMTAVGNAAFSATIAVSERPRFFANFFLVYLLAAMAGSFLASSVIRFAGFDSERAYQVVLLAAFVSAAAMVMIRFAACAHLPEQEISGPRSTAQPAQKVTLGHLATVLASAALLGGSITLFMRFPNVIFSDSLGVAPAAVAILLGLDKLAGVFGAKIAPRLAERFGSTPLLVAVSFAAGALLLTMATPWISVLIFAIFYLIRIALNFVQMPLLDALAVGSFTGNESVKASTVRQLGYYGGGALFALPYGKMLQNGMLPSALGLSAALCIAGAVVIVLTKHGASSKQSEPIKA